MNQAVLTVNDALGRARTLFEAGDVDGARRIYTTILARYPDIPEVHYNLSQVLLLTGDYEAGWEEFEWRLRGGAGSIRQHLDAPRWEGQDAHGRTVFLLGEQGVGDNIQFARYAAILGSMGTDVILGCPKGLGPLMASVANVRAVVEDGEVVPPFHYHAALMSLPRLFKTRPDAIPAPIPYLKADPTRVAKWRKRLAAYDGTFKVGFCWQGNPRHARDRVRSAPLDGFLSLTDTDGVTFFSLQVGAAPTSIAVAGTTAYVDLGPELAADAGAFLETAAAMEALDLIISVDTSVAHLAGALGRPGWVLLPRMPDWRWFLFGPGCPWYPTMRVFRQPAIGDWPSLFAAVEEALPKYVAGWRLKKGA